MKSAQVNSAQTIRTVIFFCMAAAAWWSANAAQPTAKSERIVISRAEDLPQHTYELTMPPSEYLNASLDSALPLVAAIERDVNADLQQYDIQDAATLRDLYSVLRACTEVRGNWSDVTRLTSLLRAIPDKPGVQQTAGVLAELIADQHQNKKDGAWLREAVRKRYSSMNWQEVAEIVKRNKNQLEMFGVDVVKGAFQAELDPAAKNLKNKVPFQIASVIINSRAQLATVAPVRDDLVAALADVIESNKSVTKADIWSPRLFTIPQTVKAAPVAIGIWDTGVDLSLFRSAPGRGIAFDNDSKPSKYLLRPLGQAQARWPELKQTIKGAADLQAALDTPESQALRKKMRAMQPNEVQAFLEDINLVSLYAHGTMMAAAAVEGNPFARIFTGTQLPNHHNAPDLPTEERVAAEVHAYAQTIKAFRAAKVRVVNISWGVGPADYEEALTFHNAGGDTEARHTLALKLFAMHRDGMQAAIESAPDILFVAAAGNANSSADFAKLIPASLKLPNLITVGAVDRAGDETSFSSFGDTVVVHANGYEVDSTLPGGDRIKFSGTSIACPQVVNLAAKLLALKPELNVATLRSLLLDGAELRTNAAGDAHAEHAVRLLNPRKSVELAQLKSRLLD